MHAHNQMSVRSYLAALLLVVATTTLQAQERRELPGFRQYGNPASVDDGQAVKQLVTSYQVAWAGQNTADLMALHADDTEWINAYARMFQGVGPLGEFLRNRLFPAFSTDVSRQEVANMKLISIRYMGDDAAVIHMYTDGNRGASRNEGESARRTHIHLVLSELDSGWKIVHTAIADAR